MILHHVTNDAEFIEIAATSLRTKWFFKCNQNRCNILAIPSWIENFISKSKEKKKSEFLIFAFVD